MDTPILAPIEQPRGLILRIAYWVCRRRFGAVLGALKVLYTRQSALLPLAMHIDWIREHRLSLDAELRLLIQVRVATMNGCAFCSDLSRAQAVQRRLGMERFAALEEWNTSTLFTERERAALAYVQEVTRTREASLATFAALRVSFNEREIVELTWLNAVENFFNLQAHPLGIGSDGLVSIAEQRRAKNT